MKFGQKSLYLKEIEGWPKPMPEPLSSPSMAAMKDLMDLGMKYIESDPKKLEMLYDIILIKNL